MSAPSPPAYAEDTQFQRDPDTGLYLSFLHLKQLVADASVTIWQPNAITYPRALYPVMTDFALATRHIAFAIKKIVYEHAEVVISFEMLWPHNELQVWHALDEVRWESQNICCNCSKYAPRQIRGNKLRAICNACYRHESCMQ